MTEINLGYEITLFHAIIYRRIRTNALALFIAVRCLNPISLLLRVRSIWGGVDWQKAHVVCTEGFYRYDNVRITCAKYGVPVYDSLTEAIVAIVE